MCYTTNIILKLKLKENTMYKLPQRQVHLDFHTSECIDGIGSMFDKEQFKSCLKKGHVNSITIFAKCHHGWSYFPSEVTPMHPGLHGFDLLSAMLEACREAKVAAPIYISAGYDERYFAEHPEHGFLGSRNERHTEVYEDNGHKYPADGPRFHTICMNSPYLDYLEAEVREVSEKFKPEAIFMDIVAPSRCRCFCGRCRNRVVALGLDENDDNSYTKLSEIVYKEYYERINAAARVGNPDVRIFHNGGHISTGRRDLAHANTHLELESLPTGGWGYDHFPRSVRYAAMLDMEYLGMTGKFHLSWGEFGGFKHPNALRYEVALSLANGAKCSVGDQMHPYGFLDDATYELIGQAYAEAEAVEEYCYDITPVSDIAIVSVEAVTNGAMKNSQQDTGANRILLEGKYLYDIVDKECDLSKYKLLILPDRVKISGEYGEKIKSYVKAGGKVLCSGVSGLDDSGEFAFDIGAKFISESKFAPTYYNPCYDAEGLTPSNYVVYSKHYDVEKTDGAKVLGYVKNSFFNRTRDHFCSHRHTPFVMENNGPAITVGKDGAYIAWDIFTEYTTVGSYAVKEAVIRVIEELIGDKKTLKTNLPSSGVITLNKQEEQGRYVLHALYAAPVVRGANTQIIEDLVPIYDTEFEIKLPAVKSVKLVPENKNVDFEYNNGVCKFKLDKFECKQVVSIELK